MTIEQEIKTKKLLLEQMRAECNQKAMEIARLDGYIRTREDELAGLMAKLAADPCD